MVDKLVKQLTGAKRVGYNICKMTKIVDIKNVRTLYALKINDGKSFVLVQLYINT